MGVAVLVRMSSVPLSIETPFGMMKLKSSPKLQLSPGGCSGLYRRESGISHPNRRVSSVQRAVSIRFTQTAASPINAPSGSAR